ncbi:response regulator [Polaribacter litorisediminis]|uniref:response regulator n=1 Tax=Polaribacter litorisediminis TaxID=1908341 RepID=UPI001CBE591F|nr:response regulator [Polaribacter litorisediminis]UAM99430.1 response regulator [Polaribacter litorisediminis]
MDFKYNKIMIIDDDEIDNYLVKVLIKNNKIAEQILEFNSGLDAIKYLEENKEIEENLPEVILLDLYMPLMDGMEFVKAFDSLNLNVSGKCKICVVSGSVDDNDILKTKNTNNIFSYTTKPITVDFLESL